VEDEIRRLADSGFRHVKVHIEGTHPAADAAYVRRLQSAAGAHASLSVDAHAGWLNLLDALTACRPLDDLGLGFIEDPFPPERWRWMQELQSKLRTPLAAGEDVLHLDEFRNLIDGVTILRIDATASGGFTNVLQATILAAASGRAVMTHAFPDLHAQLAGGVSGIDLVEMIPYDSGANPVGELLVQRQQVEAGEMILSEEPGHAFRLDWEAVTRCATAMKTIDMDDA
jgi:L-alanine-DL-glutamate epimerase-like enolase superfamily enzyme